MHSNPYTVSTSDSIGQVIEKFIEYLTSGLPVVDNIRHIIGYVSSDVCRLFYEHKLSKIPVAQNGVLVGTISMGDTMRYLMKRLPLNTEHKTN